MHYFKVKAGWPVWIFFSKEIHYTNLIKKESPDNIGAFNVLYNFLHLLFLEFNTTV
jgi:hypothetical protein